MKPKFKVKQGVVHVNSITVMKCLPDVLYFSIDFRHKYPEYIGNDLGSFVFEASDSTFDHDPDAHPTEVIVQCLPRSWRRAFESMDIKVFVTTGRYTANVCMIKESRKRPAIEQWVSYL